MFKDIERRMFRLRMDGIRITDAEIIRFINQSGVKVEPAQYSKFKTGVIVSEKAKQCRELAEQYIAQVELRKEVG